MRRRPGLRPLLLALTVAALLAPITAADAQEDPPPDAIRPTDLGSVTATPLTSSDRVEGSRSSSLAQSDDQLLARTDSTPVQVMVKFDYDAIASYTGGSQGAPATSPSVTGEELTANVARNSEYGRQVRAREAQIIDGVRAAVPSARIGQRFRVVYGGVAMTVPANRAADLLGVDGVVAVQVDHLNHPLTDSSPQFLDVPPVWDDLGGQDAAGNGVLFGSLDTGVWPEHPSFADTGNTPPAPTDTEGNDLTCNFGDDPLTPGTSNFVCNDKLVGGDVFLDTYLSVPDNPPEFYPTTARDSDGHGSHTSSTAAGNRVDTAPIFNIERGPISGMAPGAWVSVYKVCGELGCFNSDSVAAVEQAIFDGVDVINYSIGGGSDPFSDPVELAFLDAYAANVFVAASAGNDGPGASTAEHLSPWVTTVGASTQERTFESTLDLTASNSDTIELVGSSLTPGVGPLPVVMADDVDGYDDPGCDTTPPDSDTFDGLIVGCERHSGRVRRVHHVFEGGGSGVVLYNPTLADTETDNHFLPTVHLADGTDFVDFMDSHTGVTGTISQGERATGQGDVMASFSSRGPAGSWVKPDVTAPGVQIMGAHTPTPQVLDAGPPGEYFQAIAGTSMSSPHAAGAAILMDAAHPDWSPGQVKSALMTTAITEVVKEDTTTPADPFDMGAGRINVGLAEDPGLTIAEDADGFATLAPDPLTAIDVNIPSINAPTMPGRVTTTRRVTNVGDGSAVYHVSTVAPAGTTITTSPSRFTINEGATRTITITIEAEQGVGGQQFGEVDLTAAGREDLHLPVAFVPTQGGVSLTSSCDPTDIEVGGTPTSCDITATNDGFSATTVDLTATDDSHLTITDAEGPGATHDAHSATIQDAELAGREPGVPSLTEFAPLGDGYLPGIEGVADPEALGDEDAINFDTPPFIYNGITYDRVGIVSNGYAVVGGVDTSADIQCCPPSQIPDAAPPNNVLAPFWADLTGEGDVDPDPDGVFAAQVDFGPGAAYMVFELRLNAYGTDDLKVFQIWLGLNGEQDITFDYDPDHTNLDGILLGADDPANGGLTIGAENEPGTGGDQVDAALDEDNLPPTDLAIVSSDPVPGDSVTLTVDAQGSHPGTGVVHSEMTSPAVRGVTTSDAAVDVHQPASDLDAYVTQAFADLMGRGPTAAELDHWSGQLATGTPRRQFTNALVNTDAHRGLVVDALYDQLLGRAPTSVERHRDMGKLRNGTPEKGLVGELIATDEFFTNAGGTDDGFVDAVYQALLGRTPNASRHQMWVDRLAAGTTHKQFGITIYQNGESRGLRVDALYDALLHRAPSGGERTQWKQALSTNSDSYVAGRLAATQEYFDAAE